MVTGDHKLSETEAGERSFSISRWTSHPSYSARLVQKAVLAAFSIVPLPSSLDYDYALVELSTPITWSVYAAPVCLPSTDITVGIHTRAGSEHSRSYMLYNHGEIPYIFKDTIKALC